MPFNRYIYLVTLLRQQWIRRHAGGRYWQEHSRAWVRQVIGELRHYQ